VRVRDGDETRLPHDVTIYTAEELTMTARRRNPADVTLQNLVVYRLEDGAHATDVRADGTFQSDAAHFHFAVDLTVHLDGAEFFRRSWREAVPRRGS
jgi:hypothetical protein